MKNMKFEMCNFLGKGGSLFFARLYRISAKTHLTLPFNLHEIIIGSILGDLSAEKPNKNCNTRLQFKQSIINKEYIYHLYQLFEELCNRPPLVMSRFYDRPNKQKEYSAIKFQTASSLNIYRELFYNSEGKKILPLNLEELLTAKGLAY
ncbi:homing endonuclease [Tuber brumale]|nr:homing endonuclease [Tuber brumale]